MKLSFRKNSPIAAAEADLANLGNRRETLDARKASAIAKLEAARSARKQALAGETRSEPRSAANS